MAGAGRTRSTGSALRALLVLLLVAAGSLTLVAPADAQNAGSGELSFQIDVDGGFVEVEELLLPEDTSTSLSIRIPATATDVTSTAEIVSRSIEGGAERLELSIDGSAARVRYRMPAGGEGTEGQGTTIGSDRIAFGLWPNMDTVSVLVALPEGFTANPGGDFVEQEVDEATFQYVLIDGAYRELAGFRFVASLEAGLARRTVEIRDGSTIEVAGFVTDPEWLDWASDQVANGVPELERLVGQPWPATMLEILESEDPAEAGYAGWYDIGASQIEIDAERDPVTMLHELSHAWFNDSLFEHRWLIEGFAEAVSHLAAVELGGEIDPIQTPGVTPARFEGLNRWRVRFFFENNFDLEIYGYRASGYVVSQLYDEVGADAMRASLDQMFSSRHPYEADGDTKVTGTNDWRRILDVLELHGESSRAEGLFREYVVTDGQRELLDERRVALDAYVEFERDAADGDRAQVPQGIRYAMSEWDFDAASRGMERATEAQARMATMATRAADLDLTLPTFLEDVYLDSDVQFTRLDAALDDAENALHNLEQVDVITDDDRRDFASGRLDQLDLSDPALAGALNQDRESRPFWDRWYIYAVAVLTVLLLLLAGLAAVLPEPAPDPLAGVAGPTTDVRAPGDDEVPIYRPQMSATAGTGSSMMGGRGQPPPPPKPVGSSGLDATPPPVNPKRAPVDLDDLPPPAEPGQA